MPLIDVPDVELDHELNAALMDLFSHNQGNIIDQSGLCWSVWRVDGLDAWWRFFEEAINAPMGRRLANAACDEEEWLLNSGQIDVNGLFKKKKMQAALKNRWRLHGWGKPLSTPFGIESAPLTPIGSGLLQAGIERQHAKRYRMRWEDKSANLVLVNFSPSDAPLVPAGPPPNSLSIQKGEPWETEFEADLKIDGQRHCLLPAGLFSRLEDACAGLVGNISSDERAAWPKKEDGYLALAIASFRLFIAGEELFMAVDSNSWLDCVDAVFGIKGLSSPHEVECVDAHGGIKLIFDNLPFGPVSIGYLAGAWTRCEGRPVKVELIEQETRSIVILTSRHDLA
jgi:hypothetical protein